MERLLFPVELFLFGDGWLRSTSLFGHFSSRVDFLTQCGMCLLGASNEFSDSWAVPLGTPTELSSDEFGSTSCHILRSRSYWYSGSCGWFRFSVPGGGVIFPFRLFDDISDPMSDYLFPRH